MYGDLGLSKDILEKVLENSGNGVFCFDEEQKALFWNRRMELITGVHRAQILGKSIPESIPFLKETGEDVKFRKTLQGEVLTSEHRSFSIIQSAKGQFFDISYKPLHEQDGTVIGGVVTVEDVSVGAEKTIRELENRYRSFFKHSPLSSAIYSPSGKPRYFNNSYRKLFGFTPEMARFALQNYNILEDQQLEVNGMMSFIRRGFEREPTETPVASYNPRYSNLLKDFGVDHALWIKAYIFPIRDDEGNITEVVIQYVNYSEQKKIENAVIDSESRYRKLVEYSPVGITVYCENTIVFANSKAATILGAQTPEDILGLSIIDFLEEKHQKKALANVRKILMDKITTPPQEAKLLRLDGTAIDVEITSIPFEHDGKPAVQYIVRDITDQKQARLLLQKNEALFRQLFENSPVGIVLLDETFKVVNVNKGFSDIFGYDKEFVLRKNLSELIVPEGYEDEAAEIDKMITNGEPCNIESIREHKDNHLVPVIIYGVPVVFNNRTIGIYGLYIDISQRKTTEEELKVRNLELDNFVYKVSHDLRAPLSSILGLINLGKVEGNEDDLRKYFDLMEERVRKLDEFISDVLSHSKNLNLSKSIEELDYKSIINECFRDLNYLPNASTIIKRVNVNGEKFYGDSWRIKEIFRNLISNSIKYIDNSKPEHSVDITITNRTKESDIQIADNGIGIKPEDLSKIFDMFYRANLRSDGSGIGLYIVKNAVDFLEGSIDVDSKPGEGTTFTITIPNNPPH